MSPLDEAACASPPSKRTEPRIPFVSLIEAGHVRPGEDLVCATGRHRAMVRADGALKAGPAVGSIHKIGALVQGLPACNGWTFWHVRREGRAIPIEVFRTEMRSVPT